MVASELAQQDGVSGASGWKALTPGFLAEDQLIRNTAHRIAVVRRDAPLDDLAANRPCCAVVLGHPCIEPPLHRLVQPLDSALAGRMACPTMDDLALRPQFRNLRDDLVHHLREVDELALALALACYLGKLAAVVSLKAK